MGPDRGGPREDGAAVPSPHAPTDPPLTPQDAALDDRAPDAASLERVARSLAAVPVDAPPRTDDPQDDDVPDDPQDGADPEPDDDVEPDDDAQPDDDAGHDGAPAADGTSSADDDEDPAAPADDKPAADDAAPDAAPGTADDDAPGPVATALADTHHTVEDLNDAERVFLAQQRALVAELCPDPQDPAAVGALFDRVRTQWAQATDRPDPRGPVEAFGVALGDLVAARLPELSWGVCTDRFGTEMVLVRRDPEVLVYPVAAVAQAWEDARGGWFVTHLEAVVRGVAPVTVSDD